MQDRQPYSATNGAESDGAYDVGRRDPLLARNQSLFREVNEKIEAVSRDEPLTFHEFACECADAECTEQISMTLEEYEHVRRVPTHFAVKPGHVYPEVERVVDADQRFEVVEKFGPAGMIAIDLDPRRTGVGSEMPRP